MLNFDHIIGFECDKGNSIKSALKHNVSNAETEQVFINFPLLLSQDLLHSQNEPRFHALGKTNDFKFLHITFTLRSNNSLIRVISARPMSQKERAIYEAASENTPPIYH